MRYVSAAVLAVLAIAITGQPLVAQTAYKFRDANGRWVFTDQKTATDVPQSTFQIGHENSTLRLAVNRYDDAVSTQLVAVNACLCVATFQVTITRSAVDGIPAGAEYQARLEPNSQKSLVRAGSGSHQQELNFTVKAALGPPEAVHTPPAPYRVPFGVGSTFMIAQAYPARVTHTTPDSEYALDLGLPDGTPVYAAREGIVINARHDSFRGAADPAMLDQANVIEVLHDDGTIAIYAHLHWDSIRVHIGEHVARGEYLANSGSTGFSSGPHLHFAVVRNSGFENVSIPVQFAGLGGMPVAPVNLMPLTAY
jgi:murein DD-endopeptidase MepM/ murein hydrolase activator NlpD